MYERYCEEGGFYRMELDMAVALEINDQVKEATDKAKKGHKNPNKMAAARKQRYQMDEQGNNLSSIEDFVFDGEKVFGGDE